MTPAADAQRPVRRRLLTWGVPLLAAAAAVFVGAVSYERAVDDDVSAVARTSRSSTIAWGEGRSTLWVTSPDDDRVVEIDPVSLKVRRRIEVSGQPQELTVFDDRILVTGAQSTNLTIIDLDPSPSDAPDPGEPDIGRVPIPCGGSRAVVSASAAVGGTQRDLALVTCPTDDVVVVVDLEQQSALAAVVLDGRPTGIVRDGRTLTVSTAGDGRLHTWPLQDLIDALPAGPAGAGRLGGPVPQLVLEGTPTRRAWTDDGRSASSLAALDTGPRGPLGAYQVVDNQRRFTRDELEAGSTYGTLTDGRARLEPALAGACGARFSSVTDEARRLSGPVALAASPADDVVWVVGEFSQSVSVVSCEGRDASERSVTVASFEVGEGARGIVVSADGQTAFVDVGFDHEVAELRLPEGAAEVVATDAIERGTPNQVGRRPVDDQYLSPLAQQGRRMFNDATNSHLTPFGVVTCASCHPAAGEDGLSWRIETRDAASKKIERKVRRTPPAWQIDPAVKPLHWDGEFTSTEELSLATIQELLGGDGLLVDTAALRAYMAEVLPPPSRPGRSGERAVLAAGCAACHAGDTGTDGRKYDVLAPSKVPDGDLDGVVTPPLTAVRGRAPYGHDGRAPDLETLLRSHGDGAGGSIDLTDEELDAVLAYLESR